MREHLQHRAVDARPEGGERHRDLLAVHLDAQATGGLDALEALERLATTR